MLAKLIAYSNLILPWLSVFFLPKRQVKQYTPVAIFSSLVGVLIYTVAYERKWWRVTPSPRALRTIDPFFIFGAFFVGILWIFRLTYRKGFGRYMVVNGIVDSLFAYVFLPFAKKAGYLRMRFPYTGALGIMTGLAVVLYQFQRWFERSFQRNRAPLR